MTHYAEVLCLDNGMQEELKESADGMVVDGVHLTSHEVQELRRNGFDPTQYSAGILREVKAACADGKMIEDHDDGSLLGKLKLGADEKRKQEEKDLSAECGDEEHPDRHSHKWRKACGRGKNTHSNHADRLQQERENHCHEHHCHAAN